jgi:hypothetical protein
MNPRKADIGKHPNLPHTPFIRRKGFELSRKVANGTPKMFFVCHHNKNGQQEVFVGSSQADREGLSAIGDIRRADRDHRMAVRRVQRDTIAMDKSLDKARSAAINAAGKFTKACVGRGQTAHPKNPKLLENLGIRWDYDGEVEHNGTIYNRFQIQPNAGKVAPAIRRWREKHGGTHAVMGTMYVKKGGSAEDVGAGWYQFARKFKGLSSGEGPSFAEEASSSGPGTGTRASSSIQFSLSLNSQRQPP